MTVRPAPDTWRDLQQAVADVFSGDDYVVKVETTLQTVRSDVNFDVYAEKFVGGHKTTIVVECKHWKKNVDQSVVHALRTQILDLGAGDGYVVSSSGFQVGALEAARNTSIRLVTWSQFLAQFEPDGPPLATGLRARAEIVSGTIVFHNAQGALLPWSGATVSGGSVRRKSHGGLTLWLETQAALPAQQQANDEIGWKGFELESNADVLSTQPNVPTLFTGVIEFTKPSATTGLNPATGDKMLVPGPVKARLEVQAVGHLDKDVVKGTWNAVAHTSLLPMPVPLQGEFSIRLHSIREPTTPRVVD